MKIDDKFDIIEKLEICNDDIAVNPQFDISVADEMLNGIDNSEMSITEFSMKSGISMSSILRCRQNR